MGLGSGFSGEDGSDFSPLIEGPENPIEVRRAGSFGKAGTEGTTNGREPIS